MVTETRNISDFDRVQLRGYGEMFITQGDVESLVIEVDEELLPKISTDVVDGVLRININTDWFERLGSFFEKGMQGTRILYHLGVKNLHGLDISGAARVKAGPLKTGELVLRFSGAGDVTFDGLEAGRLQVDLSGAGSIRMAGTTAEQVVQVSGAGAYRARQLKSQRAEVSLPGLGNATVWAVEELDAKVSGLGRIEYYGEPRVTKSIQGLGTISGMGAA